MNGLGEKFTEETEIAVRPPSTLQILTGSGSIAGGASQKIAMPAKRFYCRAATNMSLVVSRSPRWNLETSYDILFSILMDVRSKLFLLPFRNCIMVILLIFMNLNPRINKMQRTMCGSHP